MDSIDYYNKYAAKVFEETVDQDMSEIRTEFLNLLEEGDTILDLGCGSGRDSLIFYELGYDVTAMDASEEMCKLAEIHTGLEVLNMTFEEMDFDSVFDGIWACASLLHVPEKELSAILKKIVEFFICPLSWETLRASGESGISVITQRMPWRKC